MTQIIRRSLMDIQMNHGRHITEGDVRVALHEAGHAIVTLSLGLRVELLTMEPGEGFSGRCIRSLECREATDEDRLYIAVGGAAGESFGSSLSRDFFADSRFSSDVEHVEDAAPDASPAQVRSYIEKAKYMMRQYEQSLDALAVALLRKGTLDEIGITNAIRHTANSDLLLNHWKSYKPATRTTSPASTPRAQQPRQAAMSQQEIIRALEKIATTPAWKLPANVRTMLEKLEAMTVPVAPSYRIGNARVETRDLIPGIRYSDVSTMEVR